MAWRALSESARTDGPSPDESELDDVPCSVAHAVRIAEARTTHLVFLTEAHTSAARSHYAKYGQVLDDLLMLDDVANAWKNNVLDGNFHTAFSARTGAYRGDISEAARNRYPDDYQRAYRGHMIMLGPHLARGVGARSENLHLLVRRSGRASLRHRPRRPQAPGRQQPQLRPASLPKETSMAITLFKDTTYSVVSYNLCYYLYVADTITFRPDEDAQRALAALTADGTPVSRAVRSALIEAANARAARLLRAEATDLAADELDRAEAAQVLRDMETLRAW